MSSGGLVPQNAFAQTGTVDWVRLGEGTMRFLARVSSYQVDAYTVILGAQMAQKLPLGPKGEERTRRALNELSFCASFNKNLLFGFGITNLPNVLGTQVEGLAFLALSAALSEVYHENFVAKVLHEILLYQNPQRESTPSLQNWLQIVKACAGTFATSAFGKRAEQMMGWHPSETSLYTENSLYTGDSNPFDEVSRRILSSQKDIAEALNQLGRVSRNELESITIVGGGDIGFLAAVAEWLFNMSIVIADGNDEPLYFNSERGSTVQARFVFRSRIDVSPSQHRDLASFQYPSKVVHLKNVSDILLKNEEYRELRVSGRLGWDHCLSEAFGSAFQKLRTAKATFGNALGCASRIFEAVAKAEPEIDMKTRENWIYYTDSGSGLGYVHNLVFWFPELEVFKANMQEVADLNYLEARNSYESNITILARQCVCDYCTPLTSGRARNKFCIVAVVETILKAALILSNVSIAKGLEPKREGFYRLYNRQIEGRFKRNNRNTLGPMEERMGPIVWVIEPERQDTDLYNVFDRVRFMIDGAMSLFTFSEDRGEIAEKSSASSSCGICVYRDILQNFSIHDDSGYSPGRIHIIPGRIEWQGATFDRVHDWLQLQPNEFKMENNRIDPDEMHFDNSEPLLVMEQSIGTLSVAYRLPNSRQHIPNIPPTIVANLALETYGLVHCHHPPEYNRGKGAARGKKFEVDICNGKEVAIYQASNGRSVYAALTLAGHSTFQYRIVCNDKCEECALGIGVIHAEPGQPVLIINHK